MTVLPVMRHMAKNHQTNLHDLQPSDFFWDGKLKGILLLITQGIQHNGMWWDPNMCCWNMRICQVAFYSSWLFLNFYFSFAHRCPIICQTSLVIWMA